MNKCLVRKLLEAGQRIEKSISRPPPSSNFFFVSGHSMNFLNTIYFTPWPTTQGGRGQRFLFKFITGHSRVFLKIFFCLPPPQAILKPIGGELGCEPNLAFLWIGLGRRWASAPCAGYFKNKNTLMKSLWGHHNFSYSWKGGQTPPHGCI